MVGLALEGGGAKGSYQAGAYMAMKKCHIKIDAVMGTSIGALNGALIASHDEKKMLELWKDATMNEILGLDEKKIKDILKSSSSLKKIEGTIKEFYQIFKNGGIDMSNYRALVRNNVDEQKIRKSDIKYGLTTIKMKGLEPLEMYLEEIPECQLHDYIVASACLPVFKKEKLVDDEYFLDGGFYNLSPVDMLDRIGCDQIYVINIKGIGFRKHNKKIKSEIIEIKPKGNLGSIIVFDKKSSEENIKYGYYDTLRTLGKIDGYKFYFDKKSDWYYERLNHRIERKESVAVKLLLGAKNDRELVIKAMEYVLEKEKKSDLKKYHPEALIRDIKRLNSKDIIYRYIAKLTIW